MHFHHYNSKLWWCHLTVYLENAQSDINFVNRRKDKSPNVNGRHQISCKKKKRIKKSNTHIENIQSELRNVNWHRKICPVSKEKRQTTPGRRNGTTKSRKHKNVRRKGNLQILGNLRSRHHQTSGDERKKLRKNISGKLFDIKLCSRTLIKGKILELFSSIRYSGPSFNWTREKLKQMDQRTRKLMAMHKALHIRDDVDRLYVSRKEWRRPWCNGYRRRKWTRPHEFKSWTWLIAFHIALIPLGKVWIQLFSIQQRVNSRTDWVLQPWWGNWSGRRKTLNSNLLNSA